MYDEPGSHVCDCFWHAVKTGSADVDDVVDAEKVPAAQGLQTRSRVDVAGDE